MDHNLPDSETTPRRRSFSGLALGLVGGLVLGGLTTYWVMKPKASSPANPSSKAKAFQCPMHPQILQEHMGSCPICGMDLVVMEGNQALQSPGPEGLVTVQIDPARQQLMGLRVVPAEEGALDGSFRTPGRVAMDETRVKRVTVKYEGWVERLHADFTGRPVKQGEPLFELFSPEFLTAQREYLLALRTLATLKGTDQEPRWTELAGTAKRRLEFMDAPASLLKHLESGGDVKRHLTVSAPVSGLVTVRNVAQGNRLGPSDVALEIGDLSRVWVVAELFEADLARVKVGMAATFSVPALGRKYSGKVAFLDPILDPKTRTVKARLELANASGELRPEMLGEVSFALPARKTLTVPMDAVLDSGHRKIVFVDVSKGHFEPREVTVGQRSLDRVEILEGLQKGEAVVTRAAFLVDSESRLQSALAEMTRRASEAKPDPGHKH